ncbi:hypothetical protein B6D29_04130 [Microgenomates bacterium UTCPR1]|nr:MAG: hypothetical protein B6D29_04130 [Microgenomates bacterium UTCPR1]
MRKAQKDIITLSGIICCFMDKPFFTIIIPTYNEEKFLPKLLNDLTKQKERDFEVIIVDGKSKDNTVKCAQHHRESLNLKVVSSKISNVSVQRNLGARKSKGKFLIFLDADMRIGQAFLAKTISFIKRKKGLLFIPYLYPTKEFGQYKPLLDLVNLFVEFSQKLSKKFSLGGSIIINRHLFDLMGGFDDSLFIAEDHELIQRAYSWGVTPKFFKQIFVYISLRRMKKEGRLKLMYKYLVVSFRRIFLNEEIRNKIFNYQMGGQIYNKEDFHKKEELFTKYFSQIKKLFRKLLSA